MSLYDELNRLLTCSPVLWPSESDEPVTPYQTQDGDDLAGYEVAGKASWFFSEIDDEAHAETWVALKRMFLNPHALAYKKPLPEESEYSLLIVTYRPGEGYVGIKTKLIQS